MVTGWLQATTDEQWIEGVRRQIAWFDQLRRSWRIGTNAFIVIIHICLAFALGSMLSGLAPGPRLPVVWVGLMLGTGAGVALGVSLSHSLNWLFKAIEGLRTERLAVKYFDEVQQLRQGGWESEDVDDVYKDDERGSGSDRRNVGVP
jgi:hypothetical protein